MLLIYCYVFLSKFLNFYYLLFSVEDRRSPTESSFSIIVSDFLKKENLDNRNNISRLQDEISYDISTQVLYNANLIVFFLVDWILFSLSRLISEPELIARSTITKKKKCFSSSRIFKFFMVKQQILLMLMQTMVYAVKNELKASYI